MRTWAPVGQTPVLRHKPTRDHLSGISAIRPEGDLFLQTRDTAFDSAGIVGFLQALREQTDGKLVVVWDGVPIHRNKVVKAFLSEGASERLYLERLLGVCAGTEPQRGCLALSQARRVAKRML